MQEIATSSLIRPKKAGCDSAKCVLLVTDFYTDPEGTSEVGVRLSDEFGLIGKALPNGTVISRSSLRQFFDSARIPLAYMASDEAQRWLGERLGATTVLWAGMDFTNGNAVAKFKTLDLGNPKSAELTQIRLPSLVFQPQQLQAIEPYPTKEKVLSTEAIEKISGVKKPDTPPHCYSTPNPAMTPEARKHKASGTIVVDMTITPQGKAKILRIVKGMPYGLNEEVFKTIETWKCQPATRDGQPFFRQARPNLIFGRTRVCWAGSR